MSILTYTVRSDHPRLFCTSAQKTAITTRTNSSSSWQTLWDGSIIPGCNSMAGQSDSSFLTSSEVLDKFFTLGLAGWIENSSTYHNKLLSAAKTLAQTSSYWPAWSSTNSRQYSMAMGVAYDWLRTGVITFSDADRKIIGDGIMNYTDWKSWGNSLLETLHGHGPGDFAGYFLAVLPLYGESGSGFNYTTEAGTKIDTALNLWYGSTPGAVNKLEVLRYFCADGSDHEGTGYSMLTWWEATKFLNGVINGFVQNSETPSSLQLNGEDYDPLVDEGWLQKCGEWMLWTWHRNDGDYVSLHDSARVGPTGLQDYPRAVFAFFLKHGGQWRKPLRWVRDVQSALAIANNYVSSYDYGFEVAQWDPADADNASEHPKDRTPAIPRSRMFKPPGEYFYRTSWDYPNSCTIWITVPEYMAFFYHAHLMCGSMQICCLDDMVLCNTGMYRTGGGEINANYGGIHHRAYNQQSISKSGVPLIWGPPYTHSSRNYYGVRTDFPTGLGGQLWRRYWNGSSWIYEAYNLNELLTMGSGNAWRTATVTLVEDNASYAFVHSDLRRAYLDQYTDYGTSAERVTVCETKDLIIKDESLWPIILRVTRIVATDPTWRKRQHWHSYRSWSVYYPHRDPSTGDSGDTQRYTATGYRQTAKVSVDTYNWRDFQVYQVGGGSVDSNGYYQYQFYYDGQNYPPSVGWPDRYGPDIGRYRLEHASNIFRNEEYYVQLIMPMGVSDSPPSYSWIDTNDWFGVRFGTADHEYMVHKTLPLATMVGTDTTPPAAPTGLGTVGAHQQVTLTWNANSEDDMDHYQVWYREKV